jgi:hypothetical protein
VPAKLTREVADAIPGARCFEISDCGHGGPWEDPDRINPVLVEFLAEGPFAPTNEPSGHERRRLAAMRTPDYSSTGFILLEAHRGH